MASAAVQTGGAHATDALCETEYGRAHKFIIF